MLLVLAAPILYLVGYDIRLKDRALDHFILFLCFLAIVGAVTIGLDGLIALIRVGKKRVPKS
jgi:hypothetical protein